MMAVMVCRLLVLAALLWICTTHFPPDRTARHRRVTYPNHNIYHRKASGQSGLSNSKVTIKDVKNCPKTCKCVVRNDMIYTLHVEDCEKDPIGELPKLLTEYMDVGELGISRSHLTTLPAEVGEMSKLSSLILDNNQFKQVPEEVLQNEQLTWLNLEENEIQKLPRRISKLSKLQYLSLNKNVLELFPAEVFQLQTLNELDLNSNSIKELPQEIGTMTSLQRFDLSHNEIQVLPEGIWNLTRLFGLLVAHNYIKVLSNNIQQLTNLDYLNLEGNQIGGLPLELRKLTKLHDLVLSSNNLKEVPQELPVNLYDLLLDHNQLQTVPCNIFFLGNLNLSYNQLKYIDCNTSSGAKFLDLSQNKLDGMPCSLRLPSLKRLDISHNAIQTPPVSCDFLRYRYTNRLRHLDLSYNRIRVLHSWGLCKNGNLRHISFRNNSISIIDPDVFSDSNCLPPYAYVDLSNNKLTTLDSWPVMLSSMSKKVTVDLSGNMLITFTNSACRNISLYHSGSTFRMHGNKIRHFMDIFNGWKVLLDSTPKLHTFLGSAFFDLGGNPLVCDCVDYEVFRYIQTSGDVRYKATSLVCDKPRSLRGQNPGNISLEKFVCDVNETCPPGCVCTNIPHLTTLSVVCTTYNHTDIPDTIPHLPKLNFVYHLNLCNLNLSRISTKVYLWAATELRLSNNSIKAIYVTSTNVFRNIKVLYLDDNHLQTLPECMMSISNETAEDVRLGNNPWVCDCNTMVMKDWIISNGDMVKDRDSIICHSPPSMYGIKLIDMERSLVCPNENNITIYIVVGIAIVLVIAITNIVVVDRVKHPKWRLGGTDECEGDGKEFDVFVSYANEDEEYVEGFLIPGLEKRDYRVCFHRVHFHGGKPILLNMSEAIEKSKRTLVFFSNNFKDSNFGMFEFRLAHHLDVDNNTRRLITIKDTDLDMDALDASVAHYFQTYTYIKRENVNFWKCLEHTLPRKRLGAEVY